MLDGYVPGATDERGSPDAAIVECACGVLFRRGGSHRHNGTWIGYETYRAEVADR